MNAIAIKEYLPLPFGFENAKIRLVGSSHSRLKLLAQVWWLVPNHITKIRHPSKPVAVKSIKLITLPKILSCPTESPKMVSKAKTTVKTMGWLVPIIGSGPPCSMVTGCVLTFCPFTDAPKSPLLKKSGRNMISALVITLSILLPNNILTPMRVQCLR